MRLLSFAVLAGACTLAACADYMSHHDSVTLGLGDAMLANQAVQTVDPFPPDAQNTRIEGDGRRVAAAMGFRQKPGGGGGYTGPCLNPSDTASDGSRCGDRAATEKPGGAF
ncbi:hypothetical protein NKH54_12400 [Mesorhizobium sp. M1004]|uniref:hypothetical protein n=1 Tax=Mesorhizobium sp. M1004 TaxID=2957046 RepID=UPI00333862B4